MGSPEENEARETSPEKVLALAGAKLQQNVKNGDLLLAFGIETLETEMQHDRRAPSKSRYGVRRELWASHG